MSDEDEDFEDNGSDVSDVESLLGSLIGSNSKDRELDDFGDECDSNNVTGASDVTKVSEDETETLVKSVQNQHESSDAESSFTNVDKLEDEFGQMNLNPSQKCQSYLNLATAALTISKETEDIVKKILSKHENPIPCDICGELMINENGVKLHKAKKHKN